MNVQQALEKFKNFEPVIVAGLTFVAENIEELRLETGERVFWIYNGSDLWLSIDIESEEFILFNQIEDDIDVGGETTYYNGIDYEFDYEGTAYIIEDGEETEKILFKDFEGPNGEILRVTENVISNEIIVSLGKKITDDDLQEE